MKDFIINHRQELIEAAILAAEAAGTVIIVRKVDSIKALVKDIKEAVY